MAWEDIMKKKKGTPWPKYIERNNRFYKYIKQKSGSATYYNKRFNETIKVFKEAAIKNATRDYRQKMKDR